MFVPSSTISFGARVAAVIARKDATSGSEIGSPCSRA
jgi:hypothetical protein